MSSDPVPGVAEPVKLPRLPPGSRRDCLRLAGGAALICLLVLAVYWPALRGEFVWDDMLLVDKNPLVKGELGPGSIWFQTDFPLTTFAFWLQWLAWEKNPTGYHAVNIVLHAMSALLVWRVLSRLKLPGAWLAAVMFAVHPVCVASVAWISELKNTLSLPFFLLSLEWYLGFESQQVQGQRSRATRWYWLSLGAFVLALLSKTSTVMLPVVLLACAWWQRGRVTRQDWWRASPYFLLALAFGLMTVWFQAHQVIGDETVQAENFWGRLAGAGWALWFYLGKALLPLDLTMIYPRWQIDAMSPVSYLPVLLWGAALILCQRFGRGWGRHVVFGLGCFAVTLFPALGFFDMYFLALSRVSDHFQYLSLIAIVALVAAGLRSLLGPLVLRFVATALVAALSVLAAQRAQVLAKDEDLWRDTLAKNPATWTAYNNLGCILAEQHKYAAAIEHFTASLKFHPRNANAHNNLGRALALRGRFAEAEGHFQAALEIKPNDAETHKAYGSALADHGRKEEALLHLRAAVRLQPEVETRMEFAALLRATGRTREAIAQCRQALSAKPDWPDALSNLAWLLATAPDDTLRDGKEAVQLAEQACRLTEYREPRMVGTLAAAYAEAGRFDEAVATAQRAVGLATRAGDAGFARMNQQLLRLYSAGRPYHEPPAKAERPRTE